ncbi:MAG: hypothetical protein AAF799_19475 [Myxococcota bacterium]
MSDLGTAASKIGDKIVDILDIFDLSFFISGAVGIGALLVTLPDGSSLNPLRTEALSGGASFVLVLGAYVVGLICFAVGRPFRGRLARWSKMSLDHEVFHAALEGQRLDGEASEALRRHFGHDPTETSPAMRTAAYTRMWVHVRSYPELTESFNLLRRYWILTASYDGVATAILLWLIPLFLGRFGDPLSTVTPWFAAVGLICAALFCWHRALVHKHYQIQELVATVAHWLTLVGHHKIPRASAPDPE